VPPAVLKWLNLKKGNESDEAGSDDGEGDDDAMGGRVREDKGEDDESKHDLFPVCKLS
jgi:hypothetical protein